MIGNLEILLENILICFSNNWIYVGLLMILAFVMELYEIFMFVYCIMSWIPSIYETQIFNFFKAGTSLFLKPFHGWIVIGRIDFTTLIGFLIYHFAQNALMTYALWLVGIR